ncbi:MAG: hypothetical protein JWL89_129 [Candidatus Saccharibacteria bacterium]|jgi:hypothetical protein|nr:hypothetical protein [Candidatus Saccharibacteria bacterium]
MSTSGEFPVVEPVYSDILYQPEVSVVCREAALARTGQFALNDLLRRLPANTAQTVTPEQAYYSNVDAFVKNWFKESGNFTLFAYRTRFTKSAFLSDEAAVDVIVDMDIIPTEARDIGKTILQNSQAGQIDNTKDLQSSKGWLYDIAAASKKRIPGFVLRRYSRGL